MCTPSKLRRGLQRHPNINNTCLWLLPSTSKADQIRSDPIRSHPIRSADRNQLELQDPSYQQEWTVNPSLQGTFSVTHATDVTHLQCTDTVPRHHYAKQSQNIAAKAPLAPSYQNRPVQRPTDTLIVLTAANLHVALPHTSLPLSTGGSRLVDSRHNNDVIMITSSPWRHHKTRGFARRRGIIQGGDDNPAHPVAASSGPTRPR